MLLVFRKAQVLYAMLMLNVFVCVLMSVLWNRGHHRTGPRGVHVPTGRFWLQQDERGSFWNTEQRHLDLIYNLTELPHRSNDTRPLDPVPSDSDYRVTTNISDFNALPQRFQDFLLHMRRRTYPMLIDQPHVCDDNPFLLLVVKSQTPHFDRRQAIRETWGRAGVLANRTVATVFLLGNTMSTDHIPDLQPMLGYEAQLHKDLLQWDYRDTFFNLTLKEILFLEWFSQNCPHAQYILKGDDDVLVNTVRIIDLLEGLPENKSRDLFIGNVISNARPIRDRKLKYFIPESVFVGQYPPYAGGGGYVYSGDLALRLHSVSQQVVLYPIDDVYTGMCLRKLGLAPEKNSDFKTFDIKDEHRDDPCVYRSLMLVHSRTPQEILQIWSWIVRPELECLIQPLYTAPEDGPVKAASEDSL
ncbi:unnamed protein product [Pleuronectes platessa]|uniref:Hexosyltransferase n=1 Tax=Pleuronectes platessa TaxID=8262 RepID=A0A9N7YFX6_PLEPL|nr:N-acetyllactosaminide beta-1,3-N-acetylglucosaminyltransferase 2a [Pleuronectes platessa]CAB1430035.1 unnamed protein product [Pleuronectes platessa]